MKTLEAERLRADPVLAIENRILRHGNSWDAVARTIGFEPDLHRRKNALFRFDKLIALLNHAAELCGDDAEIFDETSNLSIGTFSLLDYVTICAPSVRSSLKNWARFQKVLNSALSTTYHEKDGWACVEFSPFSHLGAHAQFSYAVAAGSASRFMSLSPAIAPCLRIDVDAPRPASGSAFVSALGPRIRFDCDRLRLYVPDTVLDERPPRAERNLYELVEDAAIKSLASQQGRNSSLMHISELIRHHLKTGTASVQTIAAQLNMSERSFQRTITAHGTTFRKLVEETRRALADHYLTETDLQMKEIAFLLGFSEMSAFSRAAKGWFGIAPKSYRTRTAH